MDEYIGYQYDDGGRYAAGFRGHAGDCVPRALAILLAADYRRVYDLFAELNMRAGRARSARKGVHKDVWQPLFRQLGMEAIDLPAKQPRPTFTQAHVRYGDCIVATTRHLTTIIDGDLRDDRDCRFYVWPNERTGEAEIRERKAQSIWVLRHHTAALRNARLSPPVAAAPQKRLTSPGRGRRRRPGRPLFFSGQ